MATCLPAENLKRLMLGVMASTVVQLGGSVEML